MQCKIKNGWLTSANKIISPFCNVRPDGVSIDLVVVHSISLPEGEFGQPYIDQLFTGQLDVKQHPQLAYLDNLRVSAHVVITREGEIKQYVSFDERAWHAGVSQFRDRKDCNDFSIGIELEGATTIAYEPIQYERLNQLITCLKQYYPLRWIVGHDDIAPGRKDDPGHTFDWQKVVGLDKTYVSRD